MARVLLDVLSRDELREIGRMTKIVVFGAPMPPSHLEEFKEKVGAPPYTGYGLTEAPPLVCVTPDNTGIHRAGSLGKPVSMPGMNVRVVDQRGADVPVGDVGEIVISGPCLMLGYYRDKAATDEMLRDGWLYTGDLGKFDKEGYLYIVGRKKDIIIVHGFNVLPGEVESALARHPGVKQVAVIGEPHPHSGECVVAYVVRGLDSEVTQKELIEQIRGVLAEYKVPREIRFVQDLPKTSIGKISRGALREQIQRR
jgi:long-chain acyl-CoA synthetase